MASIAPAEAARSSGGAYSTIGATLAVLAFATAVVATGCGGREGPESEIRAMLDRAEVAAEAGELTAALECVSRDYRDAEGRDRAGLVWTVRSAAVGSGTPYLFRGIERFEGEAPDRRVVTFGLAIAAVEVGGADDVRQMLESIDGETLEVRCEVVREADGAWRIVSASWREVPVRSVDWTPS